MLGRWANLAKRSKLDSFRGMRILVQGSMEERVESMRYHIRESPCERASRVTKDPEAVFSPSE